MSFPIVSAVTMPPFTGLSCINVLKISQLDVGYRKSRYKEVNMSPRAKYWRMVHLTSQLDVGSVFTP